ncbi:MAG TPA: hypothetical protein VJS44_01400 [Pyrinomonadaceae bacterium]|nr:hypothetical protein [Pyrinomonadaceae bacterium]
MRLSLCLLLLTSLGLLFTTSSSTRPLTDSCPVILVQCPETALEDEKTLTFKAIVTGVGPDDKLTYNWTISGGTISKGQNTSSIEVDIKLDRTDSRLASLTATLEVGGLPKDCANKASCTTEVARMIGCPSAFDQYGAISFEDEKARLDNFGIQLMNELSARGFIIAYGGRISYEGQASERARRAKDYLVSVRNLVDERIVTVDGGYREDATVELWLVPQEATEPTASPTLRSEDVQIVARPVKGKPSRRRNR